KLLPRMPSLYDLPGRKKAILGMGETVCHVFVGLGTPFSNPEGNSFAKLNTSNTILIIEAGDPTPWTKPEDIPIDPKKPLTELRSVFKDMYRSVMADGSRRHVMKEGEERLWDLITGYAFSPNR